LLGTGEVIEDILGLGVWDARVFAALQDKRGASDSRGIIGGVEFEGVIAVLDATPKNQNPGRRESGNAYGIEAIFDCGEETVENRFDDDGAGMNAQIGDGSQDRGAAHGLAVEENRLVRPTRGGEVGGGGDVVGFEISDRGLIAYGAAAAVKID
jgi:hypothetical protein